MTALQREEAANRQPTLLDGLGMLEEAVLYEVLASRYSPVEVDAMELFQIAVLLGSHKVDPDQDGAVSEEEWQRERDSLKLRAQAAQAAKAARAEVAARSQAKR